MKGCRGLLQKFAMLFLCTVMLSVPGGVAVTEAEAQIMTGVEAGGRTETVDFVLVLDCSGTMGRSDPEYLSIAAVQMFVDILPIENARVGVICFGPDWKSEMYVFHPEDAYANAYRVSLSYPIQNAGSDSDRRTVKTLVEQIGTERSNGDTHTVLATALLAAVDALEESGAKDDSACVILMSDGRFTWDDTDNGQYTKVTSGIAGAAGHGWPVYTIELNYDGMNGPNQEWQGRDARRWMKEIGNGTNGDSIEITSELRDNNGLDGIVQQFGTIFSRFMDVVPETGTVEIENGQASKGFTVPEMVAETNIIITSPELLRVDSVSITNPQKTERRFSENVSEEKCRVTVNKGKYIMIKLIQPMAGDWVVTAYGQDGAKIYLQSISSQEMNLHLTMVPDGTENSYRKGTQIKANAFFEYNGNAYISDSFYKNSPAYLEIVENNSRIELMPGSEGYSAAFTLSEGGTYTIRAVSESEAFRSGKKVSNAFSYTVVGEELTLGKMLEDRKLHVNEEAPAINLKEYFINKDTDKITYNAEFDNSAGLKCEFQEDFLKIRAGEKSGRFTVTVSASDPDMSLPLSQSFTVEVINSPPKAVKPLENIALVYNLPGGLEKLAGGRMGMRKKEIDLSEYFQDTDGQQLYYTVQRLETPVKVEVSGTGGEIVSMEGIKRGDSIIYVTVSDNNEEIHCEIQVSVKAWWGYKAGISLLVVLILAWLLLYGRRGIYGTWEVFIDDSMFEDVVFLQKQGGKKKLYSFNALAMELAGVEIGPTQVSLKAGNNFTKKVSVIHLADENHVLWKNSEVNKVNRKYVLGVGDVIRVEIGGKTIQLKRIGK